MNSDGRHSCNSSRLNTDAGVRVRERDYYRKQNQKAHRFHARCNKSNSDNKKGSIHYEDKKD